MQVIFIKRGKEMKAKGKWQKKMNTANVEVSTQNMHKHYMHTWQGYYKYGSGS